MDRDPEEIIGPPPKPRPERPDPPYELEISVEEMGEELGALRLWPGGPRCETSLGQCRAILRRTGRPERWEELLADMRERGTLEMIGDGADTFYWLAGLARSALDHLEDHGVAFDFEKGAATVPNGRRGADPKLIVDEVGAALEQTRGSYATDRETLAAIRDRLEGQLVPEELTDAKIKRRIQQYYERSAAT